MEVDVGIESMGDVDVDPHGKKPLRTIPVSEYQAYHMKKYFMDITRNQDKDQDPYTETQQPSLPNGGVDIISVANCVQYIEECLLGDSNMENEWNPVGSITGDIPNHSGNEIGLETSFESFLRAHAPTPEVNNHIGGLSLDMDFGFLDALIRRFGSILITNASFLTPEHESCHSRLFNSHSLCIDRYKEDKNRKERKLERQRTQRDHKNHHQKQRQQVNQPRQRGNGYKKRNDRRK
jgi:hypothetical protein